MGEGEYEQRVRQDRTPSGRSGAPAVEQFDSSSGSQPQATAPSKPGAVRAGIIAGVVACGVLAAMATSWFMAGPSSSGDQLSASEQADRAAAFQQHGPLKLQPIAAAEQKQALDAMALPPTQRASLEQDLQRSDVRLVYVTLWDDRNEDGDSLAIQSMGFSQTVALTNAPQRFAVPVTGGKIVLQGIRDGGGGITMGAQADGGQILIPVISPGQTVDVPVSVP